jgi:hypothetical protein
MSTKTGYAGTGPGSHRNHNKNAEQRDKMSSKYV